MTTEQTAQQLELAAQILRTGHPFEYFCGLWCRPKVEEADVMRCIAKGYEIRLALATPPDDRPIQPDPYAELKAAHAEGKVIQGCIRGHWIDCPHPTWKYPVNTYREKPEVPDVCAVPQIIKNTPFQLPPPPPGMQWHREYGWKKGDLPSGYRPMLVGEKVVSTEDEVFEFGKWISREVHGSPVDGHPKHRTRRHLTFTHAGKTWTYHRPGDPCPVPPNAMVYIITRDNDFSVEPSKAEDYEWDQIGGAGRFAEAIGWRYADEKKTVPLGPEDVPPGSVITSHPAHDYWVAVSHRGPTSVSYHDGARAEILKYKDLKSQGWQINRSIPLTGKWNPDAWESCSKQIDA